MMLSVTKRTSVPVKVYCVLTSRHVCLIHSSRPLFFISFLFLFLFAFFIFIFVFVFVFVFVFIAFLCTL